VEALRGARQVAVLRHGPEVVEVVEIEGDGAHRAIVLAERSKLNYVFFKNERSA
jgi:hypothetical protein